MLKRKTYSKLLDWKNNSSKQALLITGARQVGKTTLIREFAANEYNNFIEINFYESEDAVETINFAKNADDLFLRISALGKKPLDKGKTLIFLDEIQECSNAQEGKTLNQPLTWIKFLLERTDHDYIFSGSLLGLEFFDTRSFPVGFLSVLEMYPLDFEEFAWSCGYGEDVLDEAKNAILNRSPVPEYLHTRLMDCFYQYLLVGGMPAAVYLFQQNKDIQSVRTLQRDILNLYEADITKYVRDRVEQRQIRMVFEAIPGQLNNPNKRFKYTRLSKNLRFSNLETAFDWLAKCGIALKCEKVTEPLFPLSAYADNTMLKLYQNDVGLLTSQLMGNVDIDILNRKSGINFGSIFENAAAQEIKAHGKKLFYYQNKKIGEIDFLLENPQGEIALCEIKSGKNYRRHSALNNLINTKNYSFKDIFVFYDGNVKEES
ncbi:MAG: ATP-binding protein, partial [Enterococcus sp.]|nr:ATP-binding protein [Enterococcus sp.]